MDSSIKKQLEQICLSHLGVRSKDEINDWFRKSYRGDYKLGTQAEALALLNGEYEHIVICGDYDADGVCATAIMLAGLKMAGKKNLHYMIPDRTEGFGLSVSMVQKIASAIGRNTKVLIITVDNGTAAGSAVSEARSYGYDVLVTDHHLPDLDDNGACVLPDANVVVNPHTNDGSTYDGYCGAGIAYKLIHLLIGKKAQALLPICAIATIGDVMELREENYVFVRNGLKMLRENKVPFLYGLMQLFAKNNLDMTHLTEDDIAFKIVPQLNAAGRVGGKYGARKAVETLLSSQEHASELASGLFLVNERRKALCKAGMSMAEETSIEEAAPVIIAYLPNVEEGIVGIIAGRLCEKYNRPAFCLTKSIEDGVLKGSARSVDGINLKKVLDQCDFLYKYGGHEKAAGLSVLEENLNAFQQSIKSILASCDYDEPEAKEIEPELRIHAQDMAEVAHEMEQFAPFGEGNAKPIIEVVDFSPIPAYGTYVKTIGDMGAKLTSVNGDAISFDLAEPTSMIFDDSAVTSVSLIGTISINRFRGNETPQIEYAKIKPATVGINQEKEAIFG